MLSFPRQGHDFQCGRETSQLVSGQDTRGQGRVRAGGQRHQPHLHRPLQPRAAGVSQVETQQPGPPQVNTGRYRHRHGEEEEDISPAHVQVCLGGGVGIYSYLYCGG